MYSVNHGNLFRADMSAEEAERQVERINAANITRRRSIHKIIANRSVIDGIIGRAVAHRVEPGSDWRYRVKLEITGVATCLPEWGQNIGDLIFNRPAAEAWLYTDGKLHLSRNGWKTLRRAVGLATWFGNVELEIR
jgi:hypothetical protein